MVEIKRRWMMRLKTNAAVAKWLKKQEWYEAWIDNLNLFRDDPEVINDFINGLFDEGTIIKGFPWRMTPEGDTFWAEVNKQFEAWYYGD